jgi:hypothetical protein
MSSLDKPSRLQGKSLQKEPEASRLVGKSLDSGKDKPSARTLGVGTVLINRDRESSSGTEKAEFVIDSTVGEGESKRFLLKGKDGATGSKTEGQLLKEIEDGKYRYKE